MNPSGSEQVLSLKWALEQVANLESTLAIKAVSYLVGIRPSQWEFCVTDDSWFTGNAPFKKQEEIESLWNERYARMTNIWLDEDAWLNPLWRLWLPEPKMILAANLNYLFELKGHGSRTQLATFMGRNPASVSRWGNWQKDGPKVRVPPETVFPLILEFFHLNPTFKMTEEPLFLGRSQIHDELVRFQGMHYLGKLSGDYLRQGVRLLKEEADRETAQRLKRPPSKQAKRPPTHRQR